MKKVGKFLSMFSIMLVMFLFSTVFAVKAEVQINGEIIDFTDENGNQVNAQIINSRTMVPLRKIFEVLGCEINWDGETKTVTAKKANKEIVLQINQLEASVSENGVEKKITLDTAPMILENRTMVPLRFIAESLEKQVGWDSSSYTAIIIDYDYFANAIKQKNPSLYEVLASEKDSSFQITRNYIDKQNTALNTTAILKGNVTKKENYSEVTLDFSGTDELMKEITAEGWNHIVYQVQYAENQIRVKTQNETFQKMLNLNAETFVEFNTQKMNLTGSGQDNLAKGIASWFQVEDKNLTISTFSNLKQEFDIFLKLFVENGSRDLKAQVGQMSILDFTRFDNIIYQQEMVRTLAFINQTIFHYDISQDELLYDWNTIQYSLNCENNKLLLQLTLENEYNEKVEYKIENL